MTVASRLWSQRSQTKQTLYDSIYLNLKIKPNCCRELEVTSGSRKERAAMGYGARLLEELCSLAW